MNFNYNANASEYQLFGNVTSELIQLYGIKCRYIRANKIGKNAIFGEFSKIQADNTDVFDFCILPEETSGWGGGDIFSKFGLQILDSMNFFVDFPQMSAIVPDITSCVGDIILFQNAKMMEVTGIDTEVSGLNNMFSYSNEKNVLMLKTRSYQYNRDNINIPSEETPSGESLDFEKIDALFLGETPIETSTQANAETTPRQDKSKNSVFGSF